MKSANATTVLAKIEQRRAVDEVYERLREAILTKQFSPGQRLDTEAIAQQLGVSLTPVRSAIELLAADGLVDVQPRSGTFVTTLSAQDVENTLDIRCALECLAAQGVSAGPDSPGASDVILVPTPLKLHHARLDSRRRQLLSSWS